MIKNGSDREIFAVSPSGWMQGDRFEKWIEFFINIISNIKLTLPVFLIFDSYGIHLIYGTVKKAQDNTVILPCHSPNTSHALQLLDVGVF